MKVFLSSTDTPKIACKAAQVGCPYLFFSTQNLGAEPELKLDTLLRITDDHQEIFLDNACFEIQRKQIQGVQDKFDYVTYTEKYIQLLKGRTDKIQYYAAIDPHRNGQEAVEYSLKQMEDEGLEPMPVWHLDWDEEVLEKYAGSYDRLAIGKVANLKKHTDIDDEVISQRLNDAIRICNREKTKTHLFGVGNPSDLWKYRNRVYSVDTTNWNRSHQKWRYVFSRHLKGGFKQVRDKEATVRELRNHNLETYSKVQVFYDSFGEW